MVEGRRSFSTILIVHVLDVADEHVYRFEIKLSMQRMDVQNGFSLVEMIVVITMVSILTVIVVINMSAKSGRAVVTQADQLRRDLSHIQMLAINWGVPLRLTVNSSGYTVTCRAIASGTPCTSIDIVPVDPATGCSLSISLTTESTCWKELRVFDAVTISSSNSTVDFDGIGRPWDNSTSSSSTSLISYNPARTFTLSGNGRTAVVYLRPITGFAEVSY